MSLYFYILLHAAINTPVHTESGIFSVYHPGDGWNHGELSCGGRFTWKQNHIAHRRWRKWGCGRRVLVCIKGRCVESTVRDSGPWGIYRGPLRRCVPDGRWKVYTKSWRAPEGWKWRGMVDLSWGLWVKLGKPKVLRRATLHFLPGYVKKRRGRRRGNI